MVDGRCVKCGVRNPDRKNYTDAEVDAALTAYALCSGHRDRAHELLKTQGVVVPAQTIYYWATSRFIERYGRIRQEVAAKLQTQMADTQQALAQAAAELEARAVEEMNRRLSTDPTEIETRDLTNIGKNSAIQGGIHVEKAQLLNERPTQIVQRSASEVLRKLQSRGVVIEGTAVEVDEVEEASA